MQWVLRTRIAEVINVYVRGSDKGKQKEVVINAVNFVVTLSLVGPHPLFLLHLHTESRGGSSSCLLRRGRDA